MTITQNQISTWAAETAASIDTEGGYKAFFSAAGIENPEVISDTLGRAFPHPVDAMVTAGVLIGMRIHQELDEVATS